MKVANIDSKTARTVSHEPINRTAKESVQQHGQKHIKYTISIKNTKMRILILTLITLILMIVMRRYFTPDTVLRDRR